MRSTTNLAFVIGSALALTACGGGGGDDEGDDTGDDVGDDAPEYDAPPGGADAPEADADTGDFALTSPAFAEGGVIPDENSCHGANNSPELAWTGGPAAQSYAVVFTDITGATPFIHSVIYDIPSSATGLPEDVENAYEPADVPGAHQTIGYDGATRGYLGPCPGNMHSYEFRVYALDVAALPGASAGTTRGQAVELINDHDLANTALGGTFTPPP